MSVLLGLMLLCAGVGALNSSYRSSPRGPLAEIARDVPRCAVTGSVIESLGGLGTLVSIGAARCGEWTEDDLGVAVADGYLGEPGAVFAGTGWLIPLSSDGFGRARWRLGAQARVDMTSLDVIRGPPGVFAAAARIRAGLDDAMADQAPRHRALMAGLTIGDTSDLRPEVVEMFRNSGLSHVLAVSGSNVAIVLAAVLVALRSAGLRRRIIAAFAALGMFILVVGPDPSVLRAGVMGSITLACLLQGRQVEPLAALACAVIVVVGLRPAMLFSVGMHLSVAATAGIVVFSQSIAAGLSFVPNAARLMLAATLAAQVAVAPILIIVFGEISLVAPIANALALPAVGPATMIGLASACIAIVATAPAALLGRVVEPVVAWISMIAERCGGMEGSVVVLPPAMGWLAALVVVTLAVRVLRHEMVGAPR